MMRLLMPILQGAQRGGAIGALAAVLTIAGTAVEKNGLPAAHPGLTAEIQAAETVEVNHVATPMAFDACLDVSPIDRVRGGG